MLLKISRKKKHWYIYVFSLYLHKIHNIYICYSKCRKKEEQNYVNLVVLIPGTKISTTKFSGTNPGTKFSTEKFLNIFFRMTILSAHSKGLEKAFQMIQADILKRDLYF